MLPALGAASATLDTLQSLLSSKPSSPQTTGFGQALANPFDILGSAAPSGSSTPASGASGFSQLSPATMSALLTAQGQPSTGTSTSTSASTSPSAALQDLFSQIDTNGNGQISKTEFENALGAGGTNVAQADKVFNMIDKNGTGSISLSDLSSALKGAHGKIHAHIASSGGSGDSDGSGGASTGTGGSSSDPLSQALQGASSTSTTNSDGSTTTSTTYADGSKVTMTSAPATTSSSTATSSYNLIEQMIQRQAQAISSGVSSSLSLSA